MIVIFCLRTKNSCRISKSTTLPQVTSDIITFSRMVRFSCVLPLWKAIELTIMPVLTVLKNIKNWQFYSQFRKTGHFFGTLFRMCWCAQRKICKLFLERLLQAFQGKKWSHITLDLTFICQFSRKCYKKNQIFKNK